MKTRIVFLLGAHRETQILDTWLLKHQFGLALCNNFCGLAWIQEVVLSPTASSYSMAQLTGTTEYNVRLQAIAGAQRSRHVHTVFTTSKEGHWEWIDLEPVLSLMYFIAETLQVCSEKLVRHR